MFQKVLDRLSAVLVVLTYLNLFEKVSANYKPLHCSNRLENALEHMLRRNRMKSGSRTYLQLTPYSMYQSLYGDDDLDDSVLGEKLDGLREKYMTGEEGSRKDLPVSRVQVIDLRVRLPQNMRWVHVDKCYFSASNHSLDTRLVFPDLTISGKVLLHPLGGRCSMILRLRRAGIEFRTIPLTSNEEARRNGAAAVRTDSHFAEPGFLSVFAHGCQGLSGSKFRPNSKRRHLQNIHPSSVEMGRKQSHSYRRQIELRTEIYPQDYVSFNDNILEAEEEPRLGESRTFGEILGPLLGHRQPNPHAHGNGNQWFHAEPTDNNELNEALTRELEQLFSMGVRGLLTTYMQKALQPAIKETLMENMGYTLSYG